MMEQREFPDLAMDSYSCTALCSFRSVICLLYRQNIYSDAGKSITKKENRKKRKKERTRFILGSIYDPGYSHSSPQPLRAHQAPHPRREKFLALFYRSVYHLIETWCLVITHHSTTQRRYHSAPGDHGAIPTRQPRLPSAPRSGRSHRWFVAGGQQRHLCGPFLSECC